MDRFQDTYGSDEVTPSALIGDEGGQFAYREAVIKIRNLVEVQGKPVEDAINLVCANSGLGLNQVADLERAALRKYRPHLMVAG